MHGTTKVLIVAAVALQASANPVRLFERQASSSSSSSISSTTATLYSSATLVPISTTTESAPIPAPTLPPFSFPGSNGTYYICSFPSSNSTTSSTEPLTSTASASTASETASITLTPDVLTHSATATSSGSVSAVTITSLASSVPTATPTQFTVVGPSTTAIIECIPIPTGAHPHPPPSLSGSTVSSAPLPTVSSYSLTSSVPTSSSLSSTLI